MSRRLTKQDIDRIKAQQKASTQLEIMDVIVKPGNQTYKLQVPANGSFEVEQLLITYTTLDDDGGSPVDNGVSGISLKIKDRGTQRELTDLLPIESIATPGRVKALPASGADSNVLQIPFTFKYFLEADSAIEVDFVSTNTTDNVVKMVFKGTKYYV
ncbi:MAG: hypothetical protein GY793_10300 [Proteobacteria bacterium]|nr:hypothetical protein [Pseudomonadota bacterium]